MMRCLLRQVPSRATTILTRAASSLATRSSIVEFLVPQSCRTPSSRLSDLKTFELAPGLFRFRFHRFSSSSSSSPTKRSRSRKSKTEPKPDMNHEEKDAFFVVRKGDIVGVYKTLSDCQAQVGSSVCDPPVSVFKGYSLPKDAEEHLLSRGLQNALYTVRALDWKEGLLGKLEPCQYKEPVSSENEGSSLNLPHKKSRDAAGGSESVVSTSSQLPK